jgi:Putative translation initiation inhibitor, yjgF family
MAIYQDFVSAKHPLLFISGQTGQQDGITPASIEEQLDNIVSKIDAIIKRNGADSTRIVKMNLYITDRAYVSALRDKLEAYLGETKPVMTLLVVVGLIDSAYKAEIDAVVSLSSI